MGMNAITMSSASSANIQILQLANEQFQVAQKRVSTGKMIFGAADDATRYKMSESMLGRQRQIDNVNNNVSLALKTLETTDKTLKQMIGLVETAQNLIRKAQAEGAAGVRGQTFGANINASTAVAGSAIGARLSITSDTGANFTYVMRTATDTWGQIIDALNSANIGVMAEVVPSTTAGQTNLRFYSNNGKDFTFDAVSAQTIMDDLVFAGQTTPMALPIGTAANMNAYFGDNLGVTVAGETGFSVHFGGQALGSKNVTTGTAVAAGSVLVFEDGTGNTRTLSYTAASTVNQVLTDINNMNAGIKAELVNNTGAGANTVLRLRNTNGGDMKIFTGLGDFASTGTVGAVPAVGNTVGYAAPLSTNNALRLQYGVQYDNIITNINALVVNNPVQTGRNLLQGQNMNVVMDEFAGNPITIAGINITAAGTLTMAQAGTTWTTDANIQTSATQSNQALLNLRNYQSQFATFNTYMKERYDLNKNYAVDMKTTGDELVAADMAEESANMTALQTRQSFAVQAFSMGSQTMQGLLRLLG